ncbi:MAG: ATP-binding cassette domain-containing protein [Anaerolineales bacterium]|nr:ATP-binding cassette domain-containing protein [Anaerolineales bacterium]
MMNIIETHNLVKRFNGAPEPAVKGVSFAVREGEVFSLLGPNGAGKTTTISMLSCLLQPTEGDALIGGESIVEDPMEVKKIIGVVPQEIALYPKLSAKENLFFWGRLYGMGGKELKQRVDEVLEIVGLADRAKDRVETYSGGMKRRINIGVGLLHQPKLVYMDEPTVGIDPQSRRNILDTVMALNEQGMTVLYTTHYMEEAQELSDRIGIMDQGEMIALGTLKELTQLVGKQDIVILHITEEQSTPELVSALEGVHGVRNVDAENGTLRLVTDDGNVALPDLITTANVRGVRVSDVSIQEPNLEAVFLHLTGRSLRN